MEIKRVESLGDIVAFKPKEIQVLGSVYDKVPAEFFDSFCVVCQNAKKSYDAKVSEAKSKGEKPKSAQFKKEAIAENITPFLNDKCGVSDVKRAKSVTRVVKPKGTSVRKERESLIKEVDTSLEDLDDIFGNFDAETYEPTRINVEEAIEGTPFENTSVDLGDDLFSGDELNDFDWESLSGSTN